jgi:hypothetical protein
MILDLLQGLVGLIVFVVLGAAGLFVLRQLDQCCRKQPLEPEPPGACDQGVRRSLPSGRTYEVEPDDFQDIDL